MSNKNTQSIQKRGNVNCSSHPATPFEEFYSDVFKPYLNALDNYDSGAVFSNGHTISEASWDRKAAFLLFMLINDMPPPETQR